MTEEIMDTYECPLLYTDKIFGRKWAIKVLCELDRNGVMRYGELKRSLDGITNMALTQLLKNLIDYGVVNRVQYNEIPPKVEYSLTEPGKRVLPCLYSIAAWGSQQMEKENIECTCSQQCFKDYYDYLPVELLDEIKHSSEQNDEEYQELYDRLSARDISAEEKLKGFILGVMRILTSKGSENVRHQLTFSLRNDTPDLCSKDRVFYKRMSDLVREARDRKQLKTDINVDQIVPLLSKIITGCIVDWQVTNCAYDLIKENEFYIQWLCDQFFKNK